MESCFMEAEEKDRLKHYLDDEGRVKRWPSRKNRQDQPLILQYLASQFTAGKGYNESEGNIILKQNHTFEDWALLRRELFEQGYINRSTNGAEYWLTGKTKLY